MLISRLHTPSVTPNSLEILQPFSNWILQSVPWGPEKEQWIVVLYVQYTYMYAVWISCNYPQHAHACTHTHINTELHQLMEPVPKLVCRLLFNVLYICMWKRKQQLCYHLPITIIKIWNVLIQWGRINFTWQEEEDVAFNVLNVFGLQG